MGQPLSPEVRDGIKDMRAEGKTYQEIQDFFGVSQGVISKLVGVGRDGAPRGEVVRRMEWALRIDDKFDKLNKRIDELENLMGMIVDLIPSQARGQGKDKGESRFLRDEHDGVPETESEPKDGDQTRKSEQDPDA